MKRRPKQDAMESPANRLTISRLKRHLLKFTYERGRYERGRAIGKGKAMFILSLFKVSLSRTKKTPISYFRETTEIL